MAISAAELDKMIRDAFPESPDKAVAVAKCESSLNPNAAGDSGDSIGLMQIRWPSHYEKLSAVGISKSDLRDPATNLIAARMVFDESLSYGRWGWAPWSCAW